jgi:hypothetical protein
MNKILSDYKKRREAKKSKKSKNKEELSVKDYERIGRSVEQVYVQGYASKGRLFYMSFVKGIGYGLGIFIGGTIVVGVVLSLLTRFADEEVPILGPLADKINNSIQKSNDAETEQFIEAVEKLKQVQEQQNQAN